MFDSECSEYLVFVYILGGGGGALTLVALEMTGADHLTDVFVGQIEMPFIMLHESSRVGCVKPGDHCMGPLNVVGRHFPPPVISFRACTRL